MRILFENVGRQKLNFHIDLESLDEVAMIRAVRRSGALASKVVTTQAAAFREARSIAEAEWDSRQSQTREEDDPPLRRSDTIVSAAVSEYIVEGTPREVALRCVPLLSDGASLGVPNTASVEFVRNWEWDRKAWKLVQTR